MNEQVAEADRSPSLHPADKACSWGHHLLSHIMYCIWYHGTSASFTIVLRSIRINKCLFPSTVRGIWLDPDSTPFPSNSHSDTARTQPKVLRSHRSCVNFKNYWRELAVIRALFHCRLGVFCCQDSGCLEANSSSFWMSWYFSIFDFLNFKAFDDVTTGMTAESWILNDAWLHHDDDDDEGHEEELE